MKKNMGKHIRIVLCIGAAALLYGLVCGRTIAYRSCTPEKEETCQVYYLLNIDGMKGLGHSALMLVDQEGAGRIFSYNGMQYNLFWCILGKEGIGRMKEFFLEADAVSEFLKTGEVRAEEFEECSNFDRALWRNISVDQYEMIAKAAAHYQDTERSYEELCALLAASENEEERTEVGRQISQFLASEDTPLYQIYEHNCDTAARELMAEIDGEMAQYNRSQERMTPNGNYKSMCRELGSSWGFMPLGEDTVKEKLLNALVF